MTRLLASLLTGLLALAALPPALAGDDEGDRRASLAPRFEKQSERWLVHNDQLAVWFHQGKEKAKPDVRVFLNGTDGEKTGYRVKILHLCEAPANGTRCGGGLPRVDLADMDDWNVVTAQNDTALTLTMVRAEAQAIVTLVWHLDKGSAAIKFDVRVENWRWADPSDRLLLDLKVTGRDLRNATGANVSVEEAGYISWATTAAATYANGTGTLAVSAVQKPLDPDDDEDEDDEGSRRGGHLVLAFDGPGGYATLDYDPTLGVFSAGASRVDVVPSLGLLAGLGVIAAAALYLGRKR